MHEGHKWTSTFMKTTITTTINIQVLAKGFFSVGQVTIKVNFAADWNMRCISVCLKEFRIGATA